MASSIFYSQNLAADQYINWGTTSGTNGYGIRDNAGTIEFKDTGGSWAPISSSSSGGGWQRVGTVVSLVTGTDTIGSNLRPTDATYTLGDATHRYASAYLSDSLILGPDQSTAQGQVYLNKIFTDLTTDPGAGFLFAFQNYWQLDPAGTPAFPFLGAVSEVDIKAGNAKNFPDYYLASYNAFFHYGSGTVAEVEAAYNELNVSGPGTITQGATTWMKTLVDTGLITKAYGAYYKTPQLQNGGTIVTNYAYYADAQYDAGITNSYHLWFNEQGVYRVKADALDGAGHEQAIPALYNPRFTKYVAGAADYERIVQQWVANVATVGTENGGTGTLRDLNLIGSHIQHNGHVGISTTVTTGSLVGKTLTIVDGIVTAFA